MNSAIFHLCAHIGHWLHFQRVLLRMRFRHLRRTWCYATHTLSADDAQVMMLGCRRPAGWYPLLILTVEETLEQALETYAAHPELVRLIAAGCSRVSQKWEAYDDELYNAREWAIELAEGYAADLGIKLVRRESEGTSGNAGEGDRQ